MYVSLPLHDRSGDFLKVRVQDTDGGVVVDDAGAISHTLFALDDDGPRGTRAYRFLEEAVTSYGLTPCEDGRLQLATQANPNAAAGNVLYFAKIVLSLDALLVNILHDGAVSDTVVGRRIVGEITRELRHRHLLDRMERRWVAEGEYNPDWTVDLSYERASEEAKRVLIVGADLAVKNPLRRAEHVLTLALDVKSPSRELRVAYSTYGRNGTAARAADLIREQGVAHDLLIPFDMADGKQWSNFFSAADADLGTPLVSSGQAG